MQESTQPGRLIWIDGKLVPWEQATVHVLSHSHQRGSLVFDYLSVHPTPRGDVLFRLREHTERFVRSCELVGLPLEQDLTTIEAGVFEAARANPGARAVKLCAYFASVEVDVVPADATITLAIAAYDPVRDVIGRIPGAVRAPATLRLWVERERRNRRADILPPQAKVAANYASPMIAKWRARSQGYDEIVLVDECGHLAEGPTTNLFLVDAEGVLRTPPEAHVLLGVTRRSILDLAAHDGLAVREEPITPDDLYAAAEVFLTGTSAGVWPVASVDGKSIGDGQPGPVTRGLREHFERVVSGADPAFAHWLSPVDEV